ncbi:hypothetical protein BP6252_02459 [Coleophoma cylindrospora]|uniref:Membrane insertase YidC/Oxa/ALB C-terminal domain-containing protein n=1 Tax=Coleophoma cylindrospora TaxID=1849047 RepID=A0A3D8SEW3_9HELO|nr:hypothetical protein BP6252_02459 [Coleophoma cylindrospora]
MLPSRGLRWSSQIGLARRRVELLSARQFSSSPIQNASKRSSPLLSRPVASGLRTAARPQLLQSSQILRSGVAVRFASTTPAAPAAAATTASPTDAVASSAQTPLPTFDAATDLTTNSLLYDIPEHIGYLKSLGLDYGWGPTAVMEWCLEHVHVLAGTPWWGSICITAVLVRLLLLKPYIDASGNAAKLAQVKHITAPITEKMQAASRAGNTEMTWKLRQELQMVHKRAGIQIWKSMVPMSQIFIGYGTFKLMRGMANLPVPGWETGGLLWIQNLTIPDPFFILPVVTAGMFHWLMRSGGETGIALTTPAMQTLLMYGIPLMTLVFTSWLPAGLQLSFFVTGVLSYIQATAFRKPSIRAKLGMAPLPQPPSSSSPLKGSVKIKSHTPEATAAPAESGWKSIGAVKEVMGTWEGARNAASEVTKSGRNKFEAGKEKSRKKEAEAYERQRQQQIREERWEREAERRRERAARGAK